LKTYKKKFVLTILSGVFLIVVLSAGWGFIMLGAQHSVNAGWVEYEHETLEALNSFAELSSQLGYGGLSHNFKNYVLRQDVTYKEKVLRDVVEVRQHVFSLQKHLHSDEANSALAQVLVMVEQYVERLDIAERMIAAGEGVTAVAAAVRVDDYPATKALSTLRIILNDWTDERLVAANESIKWMNRLFLISALLLIAMLAVGAVFSLMYLQMRSVIAKLADTNRELELLLETTPDSVLAVKEDGTIFRANKTAMQYFGYGTDLLGKKVEALMPEAFRAAHVHKRTDYFKYPEVRYMAPSRRVKALMASGETREVSAKLGFYQSLSGPTAVISIRDVTVENELKSAMVESQMRMDIAASVAHFGIWEWNRSGERLIFDRWTHVLHGTRAVDFEPSYEGWLELLHSDDRASVNADFRHAVANAASIDIEYRVILADGLIRYMRLSAGMQCDDDGRVLRVTGICKDETLSRIAHFAMEEAKALALKANEAKGQFLANMSHEIRTPMNAVMGLLTLLDDSVLGDRQRQLVRSAHTSALSLLDILNDILDFSKLEAGKVNIVSSRFKLDSVLEQLADLFSGLAGSKALPFYISIDPTVHCELIGDPLRLNQLLSNLLSNAIKFTRQGSIKLTVVALQQTENDCLLRFSIRDTGIGMNEDQLARSMEAFSQADMTTTRNYGGTGLGLPICSALLGLMDSQLEVSSTPGKGTEAIFDLRFAIEHGAQRYSDFSVRANEILLVVEDQGLKDTILAYLSSWKLVSVLCNDVSSALDIIADPVRPIEYLLTDFSTAERNADLKKICKSWVSGRPQYKNNIIMLEKDISLSGVDIGIESVVPRMLSSPPIPSRLFEAISVEPRAVASTVSSPGSRIREAIFLAAGCRGARILVVEDVVSNQIIATDFLTLLGMEVEVASNGMQALECLKEATFDGVLMDFHMPVMNGLETTRKIRQIPELKMLPIIAMTAAAFEQDREQALAAGMSAHLSKPIDILTLAELLALNLTVSRDASANTVVAKPAIQVIPKHAIDVDALPKSFDAQRVLINFGANPRLFLNCLRAFADDFVEWEIQFELAEVDKKPEELKALLHKLKGAAENIGVKELVNLTAHIQSSLGHVCEDDVAALKQQLALLLIDIKTNIPAMEWALSCHNEVDSYNPSECLESLHKLKEDLQVNRYIPVDILDTCLSKLPPQLPPEILRTLRRHVEAFDYLQARQCLAMIIELVDEDSWGDYE
jgi:two-component system sensor histidine kinase/response regulator